MLKKKRKKRTPPKVLDELWNQRERFCDEALQNLAKTNPGELAKEYLRYRESTTKGLSDKDITNLKVWLAVQKSMIN